MLKTEILELIQNLDENDDVTEVLKSTEVFKKQLSLDNVKGLFDTDNEYKAYLDSVKDKHHSKALETWKTNNLQKLVEAEMLKANPKLTKEQLRIQELENKFSALENEKKKAEAKLKLKDTLADKKIPMKLVDFLLADDEEVTTANIALFENEMQSFIDAKVSERVKAGSHEPPTAGAGTGAVTWDDVIKNPSLMDKYKN